MDELLSQNRGRIDPAVAAAILRDRKGFGGVTLGPGNQSAINAFISTHSVIFDLTARRAWVAAAPHSLGSYVVFDLDRLARAASDDARRQALEREEIPADPFLASGAYARYRQARKVNERARRDIEAGRDGRAAEEASRALALAPDFVEALACRGEAELQMRNFPKAAADFEAALALHPGPPDFAAEIRSFRRLAVAHRRPGKLLRFPLVFEDLFDEKGAPGAGAPGD